MVRNRKQKLKKKYRFNLNRKRQNKKNHNMPTIDCYEVKNAWEGKESPEINISKMGLVYNLNSTFKIPNIKRIIKPQLDQEKNIDEPSKNLPLKSFVAEQLEMNVKAPRKRTLQLPNSQIQWLTYLVGKYGEDYQAMARDHKNYYQESWKQIRAKIKRSRSISELYNKYPQPKQMPDTLSL